MSVSMWSALRPGKVAENGRYTGHTRGTIIETNIFLQKLFSYKFFSVFKVFVFRGILPNKFV